MANLIQAWNYLNCVTVLQNKNVHSQFWVEIGKDMNKTKPYFLLFFLTKRKKKKPTQKETWYFVLLTWYDPAETEHWSTKKGFAFFVLIHLAQRWQPLKVTQLQCQSSS